MRMMMGARREANVMVMVAARGRGSGRRRGRNGCCGSSCSGRSGRMMLVMMVRMMVVTEDGRRPRADGWILGTAGGLFHVGAVWFWAFGVFVVCVCVFANPNRSTAKLIGLTFGARWSPKQCTVLNCCRAVHNSP